MVKGESGEDGIGCGLEDAWEEGEFVGEVCKCHGASTHVRVTGT